MNKKLLVLSILVLLAASFLAFSPTGKAYYITTSRTFTDLWYDGCIQKMGVGYLAAWGAQQGDAVSDTQNFSIGGQGSVANTFYWIYRSFVYFDTSIIPAGATINSATLRLYIYQDWSQGDFNITVQTGGSGYPHAPLVLLDYWQGHYSGDGGSRNTTTISNLGYWNITFNSQGRGWINIGGITKLCLRSSNDINIIAGPAGADYVIFRTFEFGQNYAPKLYVNYTTHVPYIYIIHGPYYDNGTVATTVLNVSLQIENMPTAFYALNGTSGNAQTLNISIEQQGICFAWKVGNNLTRTYDLSDGVFEELWVYLPTPSNTYQVYTLQFWDLAGILQQCPYVSAEQYVGGVMRTIQKIRVDAEDKALMLLQEGQTYSIVLGDSSFTEVYGDVAMTSDSTVQLILRGAEFPNSVTATYEYVRIYGLRTFGSPHGNITIFYQDTQNMTVNVSLTISEQNGTVVATYTTTSNQFVYCWALADNKTSYEVQAIINSAKYGQLPWSQYFPRHFSTAPWGLDFLGSLGFNTSIIMPIFLILFFAGCFSAVNAEAGAFVAVVIAIALTWMGWIAIPSGFLIAALCLAVLLAIYYAKRRITF
jgi:hypothetical protein